MKKINKIVCTLLPIAAIVPSIATIVGCSCSPKESADKKSVDSLNKKLEDSGIKFTIMSNMVQYLKEFEDIDLEELKATNDAQYVWDSEKNVIFTLDKNNKIAYAPANYQLNQNKQKIWKMVNLSSTNDNVETFAQNNPFAQYIRKNQKVQDKLTFSTSIDTGYNKGYNLVYEKPELENVSKPIINTNKCDLTINGSISDVDHHGNAKSLTIVTFDTESKYNEYGSVDSNVKIISPVDFVAKPASEINTILVENEETKISVECDETTEVPAYVGTIATTTEGVDPTKIEVEVDSKIKEEDKPDVKETIVTPTSRYHSGFGTLLSPYIISTKDQMFNAAEDVNNASRTTDTFYFKLLNDIDLENEEWTPIGKTYALAFKGIFDGNDCTINNLKISQNIGETQTVGFGLFGWVTNDNPNTKYTSNDSVWDKTEKKLIWENISEDNYKTVIKNITLDNVDVQVTGDARGLAGVVGAAQNSFISNCNINYGKISGNKGVGGIVGTMAGSTIYGCTLGKANPEDDKKLEVIAGDYNVGGIVGAADYKTKLGTTYNAIINCSTEKNSSVTANQTVDTGGYIGGMLGYGTTNNVAIDYCVNKATIESKKAGMGGIAGIVSYGENIGVIANTVNEGEVKCTGEATVANAAGIIVGPHSQATFYNCVNKGAVTANATNGVAGVAAGCAISTHITDTHFTIDSCSNVGTLSNPLDENKKSDICDNIISIKFEDMTFANAQELSNVIKNTATAETKITFNKCKVTDPSGSITLPSTICSIVADEPLCSNITIDNKVSNITVNIPGQNITISEKSTCNLICLAKNNTITITETGELKSVSVCGEGSKIINNGNIIRTIAIDGAAEYGENNGTCANVRFGKRNSSYPYSVSSSKTFVNNGTITGVTDPNEADNDTIFITSLNNRPSITLKNYGTIKYQNGSLATPECVISYRTSGDFTLECYENSKIITDQASNLIDSSYTSSCYLHLKYKTGYLIEENGTSITCEEIVTKYNTPNITIDASEM